MSIYQHTAATVAAVDRELRAWAARMLAQGQLHQVRVNDPDATFQLQLTADKLAPWPKTTEPPTMTSLLGRNNLVGVPEIWADIGRLCTLGLEAAFPKHEARGSRPERPMYLAPLDQLPEPLKKWYEQCGETSATDSWVITQNEKPYARMPSLEWRHALMTLLKYSVAVTGEDPSITLQTFSVLALGVYLDRVLEVTLPPLPVDEKLPRLLVALSEVLEGDPSLQLKQLAERIQSPGPQRFTLLPVSDDWVLSVQLAIGGFPILAPAMAPQFQIGGGSR